MWLGWHSAHPGAEEQSARACAEHRAPHGASPALTSCLEVTELVLMPVQPAWHGERYSTPLSPHTGWKTESGHEQCLWQEGNCRCIELDVLPAKQEMGNQTKQDQKKNLPTPAQCEFPAWLVCLCVSVYLGPAPPWDLNYAYWSQW